MIILSSSGFLNPKVLDAIKSKHSSLINSACIISTASEQKENDKYLVFTKNILEKSGIIKVDYIDIEFDNPDNLFDYDLIFIGGGNPYSLFYHIRRTKTDVILHKCFKHNKIIIGVSAGAMLLSSGIHYILEYNQIMKFGSDKSNNCNLTNLSGLGITRHILFPHYDMFLEKNPELEIKLQQIENRDHISVTRLNNEDAIIVADGRETTISK